MEKKGYFLDENEKGGEKPPIVLGIVATIRNTPFYKIQVCHWNMNKFRTSRWKFYVSSTTTTARDDKKLLKTLEVNKILFQDLLDTIMIVTLYKIRIEFSK